MYLLLLVCLLLVFAASVVSAPRIQFTPSQPLPGQTIRFVYTPKGTRLENEPVIQGLALYYGPPWFMKTSQPQPVILTRQGDTWTGELTLSEGATGVAIAFMVPERQYSKSDHNNSSFYSVAVHNDAGKPVQYAFGGLGSVYYKSSFPFIFGVHQDSAGRFLALLDQEVQNYPASRADYWSDRLVVDANERKPGYQEKVRQGIEEAKASIPDMDATDVSALSRLYRLIGDKDHAERYRQLAIQKDPKGAMAQDERARLVEGEEELDRKVALYADFEKDFASDSQSSWMQNLTIDLVIAFLKHNELDALKQFMAERPTLFNDSMMLNDVAWQVAEKGTDLSFAEELSRKALTLLTEEKQPDYVILWDDSKEGRYRLLIDTLAYILDQQGRIAEAYEAYKEAILDLPPVLSDPKVNERYLLCAIKAGHIDEAKQYGESFIKAGKSTPAMKAALRDLYLEQTGSSLEADLYIGRLESDVKVKQREHIIQSLVNEPAPAFALTDLNGNKVSLADLKGKIVVVDFWATWCGPCVALFPSMQQAQAKFQSNPNVKFLFINTMEKRDEAPMLTKKVAEFIQEKQYNFTIPLDFDNKVSQAYKVEGIPTKFVIDQEGSIRYRSVGFGGNPERTVNEISAVIELLSTRPISASK